MIGGRPVTGACRAVVCAMLIATAVCAQEPTRVSVTARSWPDSLTAFDGRVQDAERTTLTVRELMPGSRETTSVEITWLRLRARTASPGSPIVFLMGGPGVPATVMGRIPPYWTLFGRLRGAADVILLDQRGTGLSRPSLDCPAGVPPDTAFLASLQALDAALRAAYAPCVAVWRGRGVAPELFSTGEVAADIEDLRRWLGVPRVSLLAFSYGTRLALEFVRRHPRHVDRVVLQGVLGFEHGVRLPTTLDSLLERVSAAARADSVGRSLVPDLRASLAGLLTSGRWPVVVTVPGTAGDSVRLTVGVGGVQAIVSGRLSDPRLPALAASLERGDTRLLAAMAGGFYRDLAQGGGSLFGRAVYCSAPGPEARIERARQQAARSFLGEVFDNVPTSPAFCRGIGIEPGPAVTAPTRPWDTPALLIAGTLDERTPLGNADDAGRYFAGARTIVAENGVHELLPVDTIQSLVAAFLAGGPVGSGRLTLPPPRFLTIEEALQPPRRR